MIVDNASPMQLVGNRIVLFGAGLYLLEWVAIIAASIEVPLGAVASSSEVMAAYSGHHQALGWAAGWFSVTLLGRILLMAGLRTAFADSHRPQPLMDFAVAAMTVGVVLEVAVYGMVAGTSWLTAHGGSVDQVRSIDSAAFSLNNLLFGPTGVALVCAGLAMWRSGLFSRVLAGLGLFSGAMLTLGGAVLQSPRLAGLATPLTYGIGVAVFWVWMLWTGVVAWRGDRPAGTS